MPSHDTMELLERTVVMSPIGKIVTWERNLKRRKGLQNKDFTILSSNCAGGVIYHDLGL